MFGNAILGLILPLFILDISGSPALFGMVMAMYFIPLIIMSPIGGVIADRGRKQRIMFGVDIGTLAVIALLILALHVLTGNGYASAIAPIVIVKLMALATLNGLYNPVATSCLPFLVPEDKLVRANAAAEIIGFSVPNFAGPIIGGIVYAAFGIFPVLIASVAIYAAAAVIDLLIRVPYVQQPPMQDSLAATLKNDIAQSLRFAKKENPSMGKIILIFALFSISSTGMIMIVLPVLITQTLGMYTGLVGLSYGIMMGGGILGGIVISALEKKLPLQKAHWRLLLCGMVIAPVGLALFLGAPASVSYIIVTASAALVMLLSGTVSIQMYALIQQEAPEELVGKIIAVTISAIFVAFTVGQFFYAMLFERLSALPWIVPLAAALVTCAVAVCSGRHFRRIGVLPNSDTIHVK